MYAAPSDITRPRLCHVIKVASSTEEEARA